MLSVSTDPFHRGVIRSTNTDVAHNTNYSAPPLHLLLGDEVNLQVQNTQHHPNDVRKASLAINKLNLVHTGMHTHPILFPLGNISEEGR